MKRGLLKAIALVFAAYTLWTVVLGLTPWHRFFPWDLPASVSAGGCAGAHTFRRSYERNAGVAGNMVPIVLATHGSRGESGPVADWSCGVIVAEMRTRTPLLSIVPSRYLCSSVRAHVVSLADDAQLSVGPPLWVIEHRAVGPATLHDAVRGAGFSYTEQGLVRR